jgi:hypothetical protein
MIFCLLEWLLAMYIPIIRFKLCIGMEDLGFAKMWE